ncbi:hypothetical protein KAX35_02320 [candidate division WOR-3 bacterium]|nr:hypothetical protein [candidate division WOR-3 bacterium]
MKNIDLKKLLEKYTLFRGRIAVLHNKVAKDYKIWYGEFLPFDYSSAKIPWHPLKDWAKDIDKDKLSLFFWEIVCGADEVYTIIQNLRKETVTIEKTTISANLKERALVFIGMTDTKRDFLPVSDVSVYLKEFWDVDKKLIQYLSDKDKMREKLKVKINRAIEEYLTLDLNYWYDRIGNILFVFPIDIKTKWQVDPHTSQFILKTNIRKNFKDYCVELEGWDGEEIAFKEIYHLYGPNLIVSVPPFNKSRVSVWYRNQLMHVDGPHFLVKSIITNMAIILGKKKKWTYISRSEKVSIGTSREKNNSWDILEQRRRIYHEKETLAGKLEFKFYAPEPFKRGEIRKEAVQNIEKLLKDAHKIVRMWDPYFSSQDIHFIEAITDPSAEVRILTSFKSKGSQIEELSKNLEELRKSFKQKSKEFPERFRNVHCVLIYCSHGTAFHDRFIIIDNQCWHLGHSLNGIGNKHSCLIKVKNPDIVIDEFERMWCNEDGYQKKEVFNGER